MSENVTFETLFDEAKEIFGEAEDSAQINHDKIVTRIEHSYYPFLIVVGVPCNILALLILIRRRSWLQHEAYIYLAAILIMNATKLTFLFGDWWLFLLDHRLVRLSTSADIMCKLWFWLLSANSYTEWLHILLLLNVYMRRQLATSSDRRGCCPNLAVKCCTLFGVKVIISSFFIVCTLSHFSAFSIVSLIRYGEYWHCTPLERYYSQYELMAYLTYWIGFISLFILIPLLLLVGWKLKRSSGFAFSQMNGADSPESDNDDAEVIARIVVCSATVIVVLRSPLILIVIFYVLNLVSVMNPRILWIFSLLRLIAFAYPLSMPIVCFAMKSRFRDDLKAMVERCCYTCCPGSRRRATSSFGVGQNASSVLQLDPIDEGSSVTSRDEISQQNN